MVLLLPNYPMTMNYSREKNNPYTPIMSTSYPMNNWGIRQTQPPVVEAEQDELEPLPFACPSESKINHTNQESDLQDQDQDYYIPEDDSSLSDEWSVDSVSDFPETWEHVFDHDNDDDYYKENDEQDHAGIIILESQSSTIDVQEYFASHQEKQQESRCGRSRRVTFCDNLVTEVNHYPKVQREYLSDMFYSADELQEILENFILEERQRMIDAEQAEFNG